jgi:altronate dehydratase large subunit
MGDSFFGYPRRDGSAGVRNHVLVLGINGLVGAAARRIGAAVRGTVTVATPYGRGQVGPDAAIHARQLVGLGRNPNVAAAVILGVDRKALDRVAAEIAETTTVETVALDDTHEDALALSDIGIRKAARLVRHVSGQRRAACPLSALRVGVECGHSDATSGLAGNPLVGRVADRVVDGGGTVIIGETLEWLGAEHLLARRAATPEVARAVTDAVARREAYPASLGIDLLGNNPGEENIRGGLSTIEEKSLGAVAKGGNRAIQSVLEHAQAPRAPGLHAMDGPGYSPESITGFVAAGVQLVLFTTGPGNSYCSALAPTIKVSAHPMTPARLPEQIDFDGGAILAGTRSAEATAAALHAHMLAVASGTATWGEVLGEGDEVFYRTGPSL